ncbi:MAG: type III-B CRISPR module RAMP protein Cmr1 [Chloroflexi bacterium]|nr:type III-B CRISPR module RAMP protein Cmr1 [Chloroflexota bacterium]
MEFTIKALTPIWTGGVETGRIDRIHETGIIGSLRWWYEVILRGLGADVCDPTSDKPEHRCRFDAEAYQKSLRDGYEKSVSLLAGLQNVCPVCRLFGCTGWKRRFELSAIVFPSPLTPFWLATLDQPGNLNHWWLTQVFQADNSTVCFGDLTLRARFMRGYEKFEDVLKALLSLMAQYGAIGSRAQYGFGQFAYPAAYSIEKSIGILRNQITTTRPKNLSGDFYSLRDFWCLQCRIPDDDQQVKRFQQANVVGNQQAFNKHKNHCLPVAFDIRYKLPKRLDNGLRQVFRLAHGREKTRQVFGTVVSEDQKWGSRLFISHLYKGNDADGYYQLRVWGFTNSAICQEIQATLKSMFHGDFHVSVVTGQEILSLKDDQS